MRTFFTTKWTWIWAGGLLGVVVLAIVFDPTQILKGFLRNENFFLARPTSYWRTAIKNRHPDTHRWFGDEFRAQKTSPAAVPMLVELLEDEDGDVRAFACNILVGIGTDAKPAVPVLLKLLEHPELFDRRRAAWVLAAVLSDENALKVTPLLIQALKEEDAWVNYYSAIALGRMGDKAAEAIPFLHELSRSNRATQPWMKGVKETVGDAVSWALTQIETPRLEKGGGL